MIEFKSTLVLLLELVLLLMKLFPKLLLSLKLPLLLNPPPIKLSLWFVTKEPGAHPAIIHLIL